VLVLVLVVVQETAMVARQVLVLPLLVQVQLYYQSSCGSTSIV
jgi:hypothetical protein